jgi:hypothetical protein
MAHANTLAAEIEQLEKETFGKPTVVDNRPKEKAPEASDTTDETKAKPTESSSTEEPTDVTTEPEKKSEGDGVAPSVQPEDWEKRFKGYKSTSDATIYGLRQENLSLREEIQRQADVTSNLAKKISDMQTQEIDPYKDLFTDEERDVLGDEALAALKKANEAMVANRIKPLEEQLERERQERRDAEKKRIEQERTKNTTEFLKKLEAIVPNYAKIDVNPKFIQWLKGQDEDSGYPRVNIFHNAQRAGDVRRVAEFFLRYEALTAPKPSKLEKKITPTGTGGIPTARKQQKQTSGLSQKKIEEFYDAVAAGEYRNRPKEQQAMEEKIDAHLRKMAALRKKG